MNISIIIKATILTLFAVAIYAFVVMTLGKLAGIE
jgi:hypothetical protein